MTEARKTILAVMIVLVLWGVSGWALFDRILDVRKARADIAGHLVTTESKLADAELAVEHLKELVAQLQLVGQAEQNLIVNERFRSQAELDLVRARCNETLVGFRAEMDDVARRHEEIVYTVNTWCPQAALGARAGKVRIGRGGR